MRRKLKDGEPAEWWIMSLSWIGGGLESSLPMGILAVVQYRKEPGREADRLLPNPTTTPVEMKSPTKNRIISTTEEKKPSRKLASNIEQPTPRNGHSAGSPRGCHRRNALGPMGEGGQKLAFNWLPVELHPYVGDAGSRGLRDTNMARWGRHRRWIVPPRSLPVFLLLFVSFFSLLVDDWSHPRLGLVHPGDLGQRC